MRKVAVVTGNRAEFGLLRNLINKINKSPVLELQLYVTGSHLEEGKGKTIKEIEANDFPIFKKINISNSDSLISSSMASALEKFGKAFLENKPDVVVILGDRFEIFSVAAAAVAQHIPIAHIHGGEISEGSIDNQWRHAITKMANLHFCATEEFQNRIVQMGENPDHVFKSGAMGIENITHSDLLTKSELEESINFQLKSENYLFTYHPETSYSKERIREDVRNILNCLAERKDSGLILTYPNADEGNEVIIEELKSFYKKEKNRCLLIESLGFKRYLSLLQYIDLVVGNSSSGLIEVPSFHLPTINIGNRQDGRLAPASVIHTDYNVKNIQKAIFKGLSREFRESIKDFKNPYDGGIASDLILEKLESLSLDNIIFKKFNDIVF